MNFQVGALCKFCSGSRPRGSVVPGQLPTLHSGQPSCGSSDIEGYCSGHLASCRLLKSPPLLHEHVLHPNMSCGLSSFCPPSSIPCKWGMHCLNQVIFQMGEGCVPGQNPPREGAVGIKWHLLSWEHSLHGLTRANRLPWGGEVQACPPPVSKEELPGAICHWVPWQRGSRPPPKALTSWGLITFTSFSVSSRSRG